MSRVYVVPVFIVSLLSCNDPTDNRPETYKITFVNDSTYEITVTDSFGSDFEEFRIAPGDRHVIDHGYSTFLETFDFTHDSRVTYTEDGPTITFSDLPIVALTFVNDSSFTLTVTDSYGDNFDSFTISDGESKIVHSTSSSDSFVLSGETGGFFLSFLQSEQNITLYSYQYVVEYAIAGTATSVDVTLSNSTGGTEQFDNVPVPHTYSYRTFLDDFLYVSAQNQGQTGSVTVSIYVKGQLYKTSTSSGAYVIATAYGSM